MSWKADAVCPACLQASGSRQDIFFQKNATSLVEDERTGKIYFTKMCASTGRVAVSKMRCANYQCMYSARLKMSDDQTEELFIHAL